MDDFLRRNPLVVVLGALAALLLLVFGAEVLYGSRQRGSLPPSKGVKAAAVDAKLLPPIPDAVAEQVYPETGTRPLFTPTRRPAPAAEATGAMVKGQFLLQGVIDDGQKRIAMLREKSGARVHRVEKGKEVNGITVAEIERDKVTLRQGGDSEVVALVVQKGPATPAPPPGAITPGSGVGPLGAPPPGQLPPPGVPSAPGVAPRPPQPAPAGAATPGPMPAQSAVGTAPPASAPPPGAAPLTPEELLARRRARRAQQAQ